METKAPKRKRKVGPAEDDPVELFRKAAEAFNAKATATPEIALQTLIREGIYTPSGKLSKNYR